jgi:predicted AAA+ superfamily ATPase
MVVCTEKFVMQQLRLDSDRQITYWTNERSTSDIDIIVQNKGEIVPIEVKSGENTRSKSFKLFCDKYGPKRALRFSLLDYKNEGWKENIPHYAIESVFNE